MKKYIKELNKTQLVLYIILMIIDIYVLGSIDFVEHKIYGVLFVVINACLISFIKYGGKDKK
ncbi:MAG: hypothetical protein E7157_04920 [Lactobacillales bacterium]|nr:hypothetical protein [Lactobacillales bacterium]